MVLIKVLCCKWSQARAVAFESGEGLTCSRVSDPGFLWKGGTNPYFPPKKRGSPSNGPGSFIFYPVGQG